jgi:hypothetical protein
MKGLNMESIKKMGKTALAHDVVVRFHCSKLIAHAMTISLLFLSHHKQFNATIVTFFLLSRHTFFPWLFHAHQKRYFCACEYPAVH